MHENYLQKKAALCLFPYPGTLMCLTKTFSGKFETLQHFLYTNQTDVDSLLMMQQSDKGVIFLENASEL